MRDQSRLSARLQSRLEDLGLVFGDAIHIERCYHGRHQRAMGAWSWALADPYGHIGSQYTATECVSAERIVAHRLSYQDYDIEIVVLDGDEKNPPYLVGRKGDNS